MTKRVKVSTVCRAMNRSRQSYYKALKGQDKKLADSEGLLKLIQPIRHLMPREADENFTL